MGANVNITINAATEQAAANLQKFFSSTTGGFDKLTGVTSFLSRFGGQLTAALSVGALVNFERKAIDTADAIAKLSDRVGVAVKTIDGLRRLGATADLRSEDIDVGLGMLNARIDAAAKQGGQAAQVFRDLGISFLDANGALRPTQEVLQDIATAFEQMPNGAEKTAAAMDLFGRSGRQWIPLLNQGAEGMRRISSQALIDDRTARDAEQFNDILATLKMRLEDIFTALASEILPNLKQLATDLDSSVTESQDAQAAVAGLALGFKSLASVLVLGWEQIRLVSEALEIGFGTAANHAAIVIKSVRDLFQNWWDVVKGLIADLQRVGEAMLTGAGAWQKLLHGDVSGFRRDYIKAFEDIASAGADAGKTIGHGFENSGTILKRSTSDILRNLSSGTEQWYAALKDRVDQLTTRLKALWGSTQNKPASASEPDSADKAGQPGKPIISDTARKLIEDIDKAYAESTRSRIDALNAEEQAVLATVDRELKGTTKYEEERTKVTATYAAKREAILRDEATARFAIQMQAIDDAIANIQNDPTKTEIEKKKLLIPLLEKELELMRDRSRILQFTQERKDLPPEVRDASSKEATGLEGKTTSKQQDLQAQSRTGTWTGEFTNVIQGLQDKWGTFARQAADAFENVFNNAIGTISTNITGLIEGTKTWGQALNNIGVTILDTVIQSIIQMGVQWVLTHVVIRGAMAATHALGVLLGWEGTHETIAQEAAKAPSLATNAASASIGSYGYAALIGGAAAIAALGLILAKVMGAFAEGGPVVGPGTGTSDSILARLSAGEHVMPAFRVNEWGLGFFEGIRTGTIKPMDIVGSNQGGGPSVFRGGNNNSTLDRVIITDNRRQTEDLRRDRTFHNVVVDIIDQEKWRWGL